MISTGKPRFFDSNDFDIDSVNTGRYDGDTHNKSDTLTRTDTSVQSTDPKNFKNYRARLVILALSIVLLCGVISLTVGLTNSKEQPLSTSSVQVQIGSTNNTEADITQTKSAQPAKYKELEFYVMGDSPYNAADEASIIKQLKEIPSDARFVFHVGDIRFGKGGNCTHALYKDRYERFLNSPVPMMLTLGDNDYIDCDDTEEAMGYWYEHFGHFHNNWDHHLDIEHQSEQPENLAFYEDGILFIAIHVIGKKLVVDVDQLEQVLTHSLEWVEQNFVKYKDEPDLRGVMVFGHAYMRQSIRDFFESFATLVRTMLPEDLPVHYVHGDGHFWKYDTPFKDTPNMITVMLDSGAKAPPLKVTVSPDASVSTSTKGRSSGKVFILDRQGGRYNGRNDDDDRYNDDDDGDDDA